ncbi:MAG TPA: hypothetical protein VM327_00325 [Candidatus Thermoplasmatota archaeon]|nr:hypothetical protein [Candidatus Thermoplasmatota archaeon]
MDNPNSIEPHKTRQTPEEEEWRGGESRQGREAQERSGERGWGAAVAGKDEDGRERQQGQGGARGGDLGNREGGRQEETGDAHRAQGDAAEEGKEPSARAGSGQGATKN